MKIAALISKPGTRRAITSKINVAVWATELGLVSGLACVGVRLTFRMLQWVLVQHTGLLPQAAATLSAERRVMTPIVGAALATAVLWAVRRWANPSHYREYVDAVRHDQGRIPFSSTLYRTVSSAFSVATGAAIGREGSMIQFATAVTSWLGKHSPVRSLSLARQVSYGAAAAVAAAYQAPVAGVFFAFEIVLGAWPWDEIPTVACASTAGWLVSRLVLGAGPLFAVHHTFSLNASALWTIPLALLLGCIGPLYQLLFRSVHFASRWPAALLWGGVAVGFLSLWSPAVWGNGDVALLDALAGTAALRRIAFLFLLRLLATTVCVGTGTVGGVFTPTLFAGASLGLVAGDLLHVSQPVLFAIAGLSAFLAAVTHAPFMASLMAVELTGQYELLPLLLALSLGAWFVARRLSPRALYGASVQASALDYENSKLTIHLGPAKRSTLNPPSRSRHPNHSQPVA
jgi:CIC family chloride channel protein